MTRIAFPYIFNDADWLGGRNYYAGLFQAIEAVHPADVEMVLVTGTKTVTTLPAEFKRMEVLRTSLLDSGTVAATRRRLLKLAFGGRRDPDLGAFLATHGIDLSSHDGGLGRGSSVKSLAWLPDFQFMKYPHHWSRKELARTTRRYRAACSSSDALVVSSADALSDLAKFSPSARAPAYVLHFASLPMDLQQLPDIEILRSKYTLPTNYVHLPNQFWAHKNHGVVIEALVRLKSSGLNVTVISTGRTSDGRQPQYFDTLMDKVRQAGIQDNFRVLGLVPYADMQGIMLHANAVLNPSVFEGWSTTVEEAKAMARPVVLSDLAVHREQAPQDARYFAPDDPATLATHLLEAVAHPCPSADLQEVAERQQAAQRAYGVNYLTIVDKVLNS